MCIRQLLYNLCFSLRYISCLLETLPNSAITMLILYLLNRSLMIAGNALYSIYIFSLSYCIHPLPFIIVYLDYLTMLCSLALSPSVSLANAYLKKRPSHMKAGGSRTSRVLMEGSFYPYRCVCVSILRFGPSA